MLVRLLNFLRVKMCLSATEDFIWSQAMVEWNKDTIDSVASKRRILL